MESVQKLTKQKKRRAAEDLHLQLSTLKTSHPREFWNIVSKLTGVNQKRIPISITDMASHFQELNTNTTVHLFPHNSRLTIKYVEELDEEEEVQCAIQRLKTNKSPGLDGLYPELFKLFNYNMVPTITQSITVVYFQPPGLLDASNQFIRKEMNHFLVIIEVLLYCQ